MEPAARPSILVVEDDPVFRTSFVQAIESSPDLRLAGSADDLPEGRRLFDRERPDVLLVDIALPSGSGLDLIRHASRVHPRCDVLVITVFGNESHVMACIHVGASGYLLKGAGPLDIQAHIRELQAGGSPISPVIARRLLGRLKRAELAGATEPAASADGAGEVDGAGLPLSSREAKVLELAGKGFTYDEIANLMSLSRHTVGTYVKRAYRKLHVKGKVEALHEARKLGLVRD